MDPCIAVKQEFTSFLKNNLSHWAVWAHPSLAESETASGVIIKPSPCMLAPEYHRGTLRLLDRTGYLHGRVMNFSVKSDGIRELTCKVKA